MKIKVIIRELFSSGITHCSRSGRKGRRNAWRAACSTGPAVGAILLLFLAYGAETRGNDLLASLQQPAPNQPQSSAPVWQPASHQTAPYQHVPQRYAAQQHVPQHYIARHSVPQQHAPQHPIPQPHGLYQPVPYQDGACQSGDCEPVLCQPVPCQPHGIYGGFEFLFMRAHFDQNVAMIIDPVPGNTSVPFDYGYELSPRTWIGWQGANHGGFRATYWQFDERADTESATAVAGGTPVFLYVEGAGGNLTRNAFADLGETFTSTHELKLQALDLEVTERFRLSSLQILAGAGLRLARMDQEMRAEVHTAGGLLEEVVTNDLRFEGVGPTVSMQIRRAIGASRFSLYSGLRGSLLIGETRQKIFEMKGGGANVVEDVADHREVLSVGELALGIEYARPVGAHSQWFVRSGYEIQAWADAGGPVDSESTISLDGISLATGFLY